MDYPTPDALHHGGGTMVAGLSSQQRDARPRSTRLSDQSFRSSLTGSRLTIVQVKRLLIPYILSQQQTFIACFQPSGRIGTPGQEER